MSTPSPTMTPNVRNSICPSVIFGNVSYGMTANMRPRAYGLRSRVFPRGEGFAPATDVCREAVRVGWTPRPLVVEVHRRRLGDERVDDAPLLFEGVGATEAARVTFHRVFEQ